MNNNLLNITEKLQQITHDICCSKTLKELFDLSLKHQIKFHLFEIEDLKQDGYIGCSVKNDDFIITFDMLTDDNDNINELNFKGKIEIYIPATHNYIKLPLFDLLDIERAKQYNYMF